MNYKKGFSLSELLVVVAIISVLVIVGVPIFTSKLEYSREETDLANMKSAMSAGSALLCSGEDLDGNTLTEAGTYCYFDADSGKLVKFKPKSYGRGTVTDGGCENYYMVNIPDDSHEQTVYSGATDVKDCVLRLYLSSKGTAALSWVNENYKTVIGNPTENEIKGLKEYADISTYKQLDEAFTNGGLYRLQNNIDIPIDGRTLLLDSGKILDIDLNGYTITELAPRQVIKISKGARLEVNDSKGNGCIMGCDKPLTDEYGVLLFNEGELVVNGGILKRGLCSSVRPGGAIYNEKGNVLINNCSIYDCHNSNNGAAIYASGGNVDINNIYIDSSNYSGYADSVYVCSSCNFRIYDGEFNGKMEFKKANLFIYGGTFNDNVIYVKATYEVYGGRFKVNSFSENLPEGYISYEDGEYEIVKKDDGAK